MKKIDIIIEPSTLIVQLKRYKYESKNRKIRKCHEEIIISKKIKMPGGTTYTVSSIVNHIGSSPEEGHYNLLIFDEKDDSFVLLDDLNVLFDVQITQEMRSSSYVVFYTKDA